MLTLTASRRRAARIRRTATLSSIVNYFSHATGVRVRACWHALLLYTKQELIYIDKAVAVVVVVAAAAVRVRACWHALLPYARQELIYLWEVVIVVAVRGISCCCQVFSTILDVVILTANLGTYLALEQYYFRNADLRRDLSGLDRLYLGIFVSNPLKSRSVN
jgi:hypothetical protein